MFKDQEPSRPTILPLVIEFTDLTFSASECGCDPFISVSYTNWNWVQNFPLKAVLDRAVSMVDRLISDTSPLANFQSVHVRYPPLSTAFWKHVLGQPQDLRYLKLTRGYMPDLASVLSFTTRDHTENQDGDADRGPNRMFAPALEELELCGIVFPTEPPDLDAVNVSPASNVSTWVVGGWSLPCSR